MLRVLLQPGLGSVPKVEVAASTEQATLPLHTALAATNCASCWATVRPPAQFCPYVAAVIATVGLSVGGSTGQAKALSPSVPSKVRSVVSDPQRYWTRIAFLQPTAG